MASHSKLIATALLSIAAGAAGSQILHAQGSAPAFLIAEVQVTDAEAYRAYIPKAAQYVAQYGGKYLARGGTTTSLEGPEPAGRVAVLQFPSADALQRFYNSAEYREIAPIRQKASKSRFFTVEGVTP